MISRIWHGWTSPSNADAYEDLFRKEVFTGIKGCRIPGFVDIQMLRGALEWDQSDVFLLGGFRRTAKRATSRIAVASIRVGGRLGISADARADACGGYDALASQSSETPDPGGGNTMNVGPNHSMQVNDGASGPRHPTIGECKGTFLNHANGSSEGQGYCLRKDKDGDTYWLRWAVEPGAKRGTFQTIGGTGTFAKMSNKGWWEFAAGQDKFSATK